MQIESKMNGKATLFHVKAIQDVLKFQRKLANKRTRKAHFLQSKIGKVPSTQML